MLWFTLQLALCRKDLNQREFFIYVIFGFKGLLVDICTQIKKYCFGPSIPVQSSTFHALVIYGLDCSAL